MDVQPLQGKALLALQHPSPSIEAYEGAVRSSKTVTTLIDWLRFIRKGPQGNLAMIGRTERTVINNMVLPLQEMLGPKRVAINYGQGTVRILGREVRLFGANNEQSRTKIQGLTLAGALVDEAGVVPESFFNMLYSRLSVPGAKLWLTANPEGPNHWLKVKWLDRARLWITKSGKIIRNDSPDAIDLHRYTFTLHDNPSLTKEYVARLIGSYTGMWKRRYVDAEWVSADGAVFDMWDAENSIYPWAEIPPIIDFLATGIDYGTTNATSAIALALYEDNRLYAVNETRIDKTNRGPRALTDGEQSKWILDWLNDTELAPATEYRPQFTIIDPAAASFKTQMNADGAWNVMDADNDVSYGIRTMASGLSRGWLRITDKCPGLINEIPGYSWDPKAQKLGEDKPIKTADHSIDGFRYGVVTTENRWRPAIDHYIREEARLATTK